MPLEGTMAFEVKTIGASGQLSLGKKYAGRTVAIEELEEGVWMVKTCKVIPENEAWLLETQTKERLDRAIAWAEKHAAKESDLRSFERKLRKPRPSK
jgi:hypothetical protein